MTAIYGLALVRLGSFGPVFFCFCFSAINVAFYDVCFRFNVSDQTRLCGTDALDVVLNGWWDDCKRVLENLKRGAR